MTIYSGPYGFAQTDQADQTAAKLLAANSAVEQAFNVVLGAEKAGANVTGLLIQLNVAAGDLAQAENAYHSGDSNKALAQIGPVSAIAQEVTKSAQDAKQNTSVSGQFTFGFIIAFSVIASLALILVLFLVWRRVKRGFMGKLPTLKPEVTLDEV